MWLVRKARAWRYAAAISEHAAFYAPARSADDIRRWQLGQFNLQWSGIRERVAYYRDLSERLELPTSFASWEEVRERLPAQDRPLLQARRKELQDLSQPIAFLRTTGGSTGAPVQLASWKSEMAFANRDFWLARGWFGITPADRLFLIWGHSHLLGTGMRGKLNAWKRETKDALLGYCRWSAYDLSAAALQRAADALLRFRPAFMVAYSVALDQFARVNAGRAPEFHRLGLKAVIATAEAFPREDSAALVSQVLGCQVVMEYGAVETGPLAYQGLDGRFRIFWRHYAVDAVPSMEVPGAYELDITSLYPRCVPLIRYRLGDLISENPRAEDFDQTFGRVIGRCNDCLSLPDGTVVHSEAFAHAIKECPDVLRFQVMQHAGGRIRFNYVSRDSRTDEANIRRRLAVIHPLLGGVELLAVRELRQTVAGKSRAVLKE